MALILSYLMIFLEEDITADSKVDSPRFKSTRELVRAGTTPESLYSQNYKSRK